MKITEKDVAMIAEFRPNGHGRLDCGVIIRAHVGNHTEFPCWGCRLLSGANCLMFENQGKCPGAAGNFHFVEEIREIEIVSYSGEYPNLCSGLLTVRMDGRIFTFGGHPLVSGGSVDWQTDELNKGAWTFTPRKSDILAAGISDEDIAKIERMVNENVQLGCCGGCI